MSSPRPRTSSKSTTATSSSTSTTRCARLWSGWTSDGPTRTTRSRAGRHYALAPDDLDRPVEAREREGVGLGLDRLAPRRRQALPRVDSHGVLRAAPGAAD